jgi:hypothetical protein
VGGAGAEQGELGRGGQGSEVRGQGSYTFIL